MKKLLTKFDKLITTDTATNIMFALTVFMLLQMAVINAILGNWSELFYILIIGGFLVFAIKSKILIKKMFDLIEKQQDLINSYAKENHLLKKETDHFKKLAEKANKRRQDIKKINKKLRKELGQEVEEDDGECQKCNGEGCVACDATKLPKEEDNN